MRLSDADLCELYVHRDYPCTYCGERHTPGAECAAWLLVEHEGLETADYPRARQIERALHVADAVADRDDPTGWFHLADEADGRLAELLRETRARHEAWLAAEYPDTATAAAE